MKTRNAVAGLVVGCLLSAVGSVVNCGGLDPQVSEVLNRSPVSKEAQDLRDAARKAQKDYFAARADNPYIQNLEKQIVKLIGDARAFQARQASIAAADPTLKVLKETCDEAANVAKTAKGDAAATALANARKAQETFAAARANNPEIKALEAQIAAIGTETDALRVQQDAIADADPKLQELKTVWKQAMAAAKDYLPTRVQQIQLSQDLAKAAK